MRIKEGQKLNIRANVFMSFALMESMSLNPVNVASKYEFNNFSSNVKSVSLEKSQQLSQEISEYSNILLNKSFCR